MKNKFVTAIILLALVHCFCTVIHFWPLPNIGLTVTVAPNSTAHVQTAYELAYCNTVLVYRGSIWPAETKGGPLESYRLGLPKDNKVRMHRLSAVQKLRILCMAPALRDIVENLEEKDDLSEEDVYNGIVINHDNKDAPVLPINKNLVSGITLYDFDFAIDNWMISEEVAIPDSDSNKYTTDGNPALTKYALYFIKNFRPASKKLDSFNEWMKKFNWDVELYMMK